MGNGGAESTGRAQVGIGTLIVFIAMVLVAAIAAGVLVGTGEDLQSKSKQVGQESSSQVSNRVMVVSALGHVTPEVNDRKTKSGGDAVENESVDVVALTVKLAPGSGTVNLSEATIEWVGPNQATTLVHGDNADHEPTVSGTGSGAFSASGLQPAPGGGGGGSGGGGGGSADGGTHQTFNTYALNDDQHAVLDDQRQRVRVYLNASQIESNSDGGAADPDSKPLAEGSTVRIKIVTESGATSVYEIVVPESLAEEEYVMV